MHAQNVARSAPSVTVNGLVDDARHKQIANAYTRFPFDSQRRPFEPRSKTSAHASGPAIKSSPLSFGLIYGKKF